MARQLSKSDVNHLRRMVAWVRCEYFLTPEELVAAVNGLTEKLGEPSEEAKARLVAWYGEKKKVPQYIHAAVKALEKVVREIEGDVIDADVSAVKALSRENLVRPRLLDNEGAE